MGVSGTERERESERKQNSGSGSEIHREKMHFIDYCCHGLRSFIGLVLIAQFKIEYAGCVSTNTNTNHGKFNQIWNSD